MTYDELTDEQKKMVEECETVEDVLSLAKQEGYDLSDEELEAINGGSTKTKISKSTHAAVNWGK